MTIRSARVAFRRSQRALVGLALFLGVTAGTTSISAASETEETQQPVEKYVAMGDSYAAGMADIIDLTSGPCGQGRVSYPKIVAEHVGSELIDLTCNGASILTMTAQIGAVPADTDLITVTTGLNDFPWADLTVACGVGNLIPIGIVAPEFGPCSIGNDMVGDGLKLRTDAYRESLRGFLDALGAQAPNARIFLVGYPKIVPPPEEQCWPIVPLTGADLTFYEKMYTAPNDVMIEFAKDQTYPRVGYVDTHWGSTGHDICKAESWINPWFSFAYGQAPVHPNEAGINAMANEVLRALGLSKN